MKVIHLNTFDTVGGAARAAYRIHKGICNLGIESAMLSRYKHSTDSSVYGNDRGLISTMKNIFREKAEQIPLKFYKPIDFLSTAWLSNKSLVSKLNNSDADIINLHWINLGYLSIGDVSKITKPVVWTLHDIWPITGGCHYSGDCDKYTSTCGSCPQLASLRETDLSTSLQSIKIKSFKRISQIIAPSHWMKNRVNASSIFRDTKVNVIPYGIDTDLYKPSIDDLASRKKFNLPEDKILILYPGYPDISNKRKGFSYVVDALSEVEAKHKHSVELVVLGRNESSNDIGLKMKINYIERLNDDRLLSEIYSLSDFSICPSMEDNLPNTVLESLSCGTPVIGFEVGGIPDMIHHNYNGFLVARGNSFSFGTFMNLLIESPELRKNFSHNSRLTILNKFNMMDTSKMYLDLYENIVIR